MRRKRLLWQIYPPYLLIILLSLLAVAWYASASIRRFYHERTVSDLAVRARLMEKLLAENDFPRNIANTHSLCKALGKTAAARFTVILPSGKVVGDSYEDPARMDNHAERPEFKTALAGKTGASTRFSHTTQQEMVYVAIPFARDGVNAGAVRAAVPATDIDRALTTIYLRVLFGGLVAAVAAAAVSLVISRRISRPLEEMRQGAERFASGEMMWKLNVPDTEEIGGLAEAMNQMASQLDEKIRAILRQRNEQEAVLSSMAEGVLAVDAEERVISLNDAAARLMGVELIGAHGRTIQETVRNPELQRFVARALSSRQLIEDEISLYGDGERTFQARGTPLRDSHGLSIGALVVFNDVTRLRQLEKIRRDFVANASHELKTPITSIKGFVETLLDGAVRNPADAERFLRIIAKQADRLNAIVEDLLALSRIEQEAEKGEINLEKGPLKKVLDSAVLSYQAKADAKNIKIELVCGENVDTRMNAPLLQQAIENLLDNAIKYGDPHTTVRVEATKTDSEILIDVRDQGCGIPAEHLQRIFERFYTVDKARSRRLGGTGLGLAIVKHIAQAHHGHVTVESTPAKGSMFTIHLPG
ncbi:PAS domain-containing protein [Candidatus Poribacteria bacterium]|nr:PAS domain-containing protein [Candidatus Poribacteria bacterium]